jgi:predicted hotdog family 3-hydroxylacyl-ACP dehydratase
MIAKRDIAALIPHQGRMCLLDEVTSHGPDHVACVVRTHRASDNPLRVAGGLPALCGIEYAAQAMAVHGRLAGQDATSRAGYLASVRDLVCHAASLDVEGELVIDVRRVMADEARAVYAFSICAGGRELVAGRAAVLLE